MGFSATRSTVQTSGSTHTFGTQGHPVKITPIYHTSLLIEVGNKSIYIAQPSPRTSPACHLPMSTATGSTESRSPP